MLFRSGLDAYEYQAGNGITASEATLAKIGEKARAEGIKMSLHTPYYISLSGVETEKRLKSLDYISKSLRAAELLGADTIVIHSGSAAKISRDEAMALARDHALLQGTVLIQGSSLSLLHLLDWQAGSSLLVPPGKPLL